MTRIDKTIKVIDVTIAFLYLIIVVSVITSVLTSTSTVGNTFIYSTLIAAVGSAIGVCLLLIVLGLRLYRINNKFAKVFSVVYFASVLYSSVWVYNALN